MLVDKVMRAQKGCKDSMQDIITQFLPLLRHYSRILYIEDSFDELLLAFIEIIHTIPLQSLKNNCDGIIVKYISTSMKNSYIALIRKNSKNNIPTISWDEMTESQWNRVYSMNTNSLNYTTFDDILSSCSSLTKKEKSILKLIYIYGYSSTEIARQFSSSKQNINQIKKRALKKLQNSKLLNSV